MTIAGTQGTYWLVALIVFQTICAMFFLGDVIEDIVDFAIRDETRLHVGIEMAATLGLLAGIAVEALVLVRLLRRTARTEKAMGIAQGALNELIGGYFRDWGLTPSEEDVAAFTLKGFSIAEIASFRGSAEGTIKTHLNAIYRKAGVSGRAQLVSLLLEDLMRSPLVRPDMAGSAEPQGESAAG